MAVVALPSVVLALGSLFEPLLALDGGLLTVPQLAQIGHWQVTLPCCQVSATFPEELQVCPGAWADCDGSGLATLSFESDLCYLELLGRFDGHCAEKNVVPLRWVQPFVSH